MADSNSPSQTGRISSSESCFKKRTLVDYFSPISNKRCPPFPACIATGDNWLVEGLPTELHKAIFQLLSVQDLTHLSQTCHRAASLVGSFRGPLPHVVKEQLLPYGICFFNRCSGGSSFTRESRDRVVRFLLRTRSHGIVQVVIQFSTAFFAQVLYDEVRVTRRDPDPFVIVQVRRQLRHRNGSESTWMPLFCTGERRFVDTSLSFELEGYGQQHSDGEDSTVEEDRGDAEDDEGEALSTLTISAESSLRVCMHSLYKCAIRMEFSPAHYNFPNLDYFLDRALPKVLHPYLPCKYQLDPIRKQKAPRLGALWKHRYAPSPQARDLFFQNRWNSPSGFSRFCFIHDIPWYREWYPKPVVLSPRNLLASLPIAILSQSVTPFLCEVDVASLKDICPALDVANE